MSVMSYKTKVFKIDDTGERAVLIVDHLGMPVDLPCRYLLRQRETRATRTVLNLGKNICQLYRWAESLDIDLNERIRTGYIFGITEIDSLVKYLAMNQRQLVKRSSSSRDSDNTVRFANYVTGSMLKQKIDAVKGYFTWLGRLAVEGRTIIDPYYSTITDAIKDLNDQLDARKVRSKSKPRIGLSEQEQRFLLEVLHPDNPRNPFEIRTKVRNYLIMKILLLCGVRLGELLALKVENCFLTGDTPYIYFSQNLTKERDPRTLPPEIKTLPRKIYITPSIADELDSYIMNERKYRGREARKIASYVFLNTFKKPSPMTEGAIYHFISLLKVKFPDQFANLHPHRLRHTFADNFNLIFSKSLGEVEFLTLQRWLSGWGDTSNQGQAYTYRSQELKAQRCLIQLQEHITKGIWKSERISTVGEQYDKDIPW